MRHTDRSNQQADQQFKYIKCLVFRRLPFIHSVLLYYCCLTFFFELLLCLLNFIGKTGTLSNKIAQISENCCLSDLFCNIIRLRDELYCSGIIRNNSILGGIMLGDFEQYLRQKAFIQEKYVPYYRQWVSYCYLFLGRSARQEGRPACRRFHAARSYRTRIKVMTCRTKQNLKIEVRMGLKCIIPASRSSGTIL